MMLLRDFTPRLYQETIFSTCSLHNTLVVLPTGLGKTGISLLLATQRLTQYPQSKILVLAPTKPLLDQHHATFVTHLNLPEEAFCTLSGLVAPSERAALWQKSKIFFATPQTVENDIISGKINLAEVSLLCVDECHRATGNYSYVHIAKKYVQHAQYPRILGLTASPGSDREKIYEIMHNLFVECIEIRDEGDDDVKPYVQNVNVDYCGVEFPAEYKIIHENLKLSFRRKLDEIKGYGYLNDAQNRSKRDILQLQAVLQSQIAQGEREPALLKSVSLAAEALKIEHAIELVETQGLHAVEKYLSELYEKAQTTKTKATQNLARDPHVYRAYVKVKEFGLNESLVHPKIAKLRDLLQQELAVIGADSRIIIFTQYRDTAHKVLESLTAALPEIKATIFFGQTHKQHKGLSQKEQRERIVEFREGTYNVIIMTSVGEEGLDIPEVDLVVFYEPIPSAIRTIQRRGRTGRKRAGKVVVLYTKGTRDEAYRWSAHHKEKQMYRNLRTIVHSLPQHRGSEFSNQHALQHSLQHAQHTQRAQHTQHTLSATSAQSSQQFQQSVQSSPHALRTLDSFIDPITHSSSVSSEQQSQLPPLQTSQQLILAQHKIFADTREKGSEIIRSLNEHGCLIELIRLEAGDYVLSKEVGVEFKRVKDFVDSLIDGRLLEQVKKLKEHYTKPLLVIEGVEDLFAVRNVHHNAIVGILATIVIDYRIPVLQTKNARETTQLFQIIILRESREGGNSYSPHGNKGESLKSIQEYVVSALPSIGLPLAKKLLREFKTISAIATASEAELQRVALIGDKKARQIREVFNEGYKE